MRILGTLLVALALAAPLAAEPSSSAPGPAAAAPRVAIRPYFLITGQEFSARQSFDAAFGSAFQPFYGGGAEVGLRGGLFADLAVSHFGRTGQRAFISNGQSFGLGIPLTASVTPVELTGGYRFLHLARRIIPYAGIGIGDYFYREASGFADAGENLSTSHIGYLVVGGAEFRVYRWIGAAADVQYTRVPGILGRTGLSQEAGETNLGGTAVRVRVIVGR